MSSPAFTSPSCKTMIDLQKALKSMPSQYQPHLEIISRDTLADVASDEEQVVGVWEVSDDLDGLLQIMQVFYKLRKNAADGGNQTTASVSGGKTKEEEKSGGWGFGEWGGKKEEDEQRQGGESKGPRMVVISQERKGRDAYKRIVECFRHWTEEQGETRLQGAATVFGGVVVVRGAASCERKVDEEEMKGIVKRIDVVLERVLSLKKTRRSSSSTSSSSGKHSRRQKIVWHHGPVLSLLLTWINFTTSMLRESLSSITLAAPLTFTSGAQPSPHGMQNTPADFKRLHQYATRLSIPVLILDPITQLIHYASASAYTFYLGYYIKLFLPSDVATPHYHKALDELVTFAFAVRAQVEKKYGNLVVEKVKLQLNRERSRHWARKCIDSSSYNLSSSSPPSGASINQAATLADCPWAPLTSSNPQIDSSSPLPSFSRFHISPGSCALEDPVQNAYIAAPVSFDFASNTYSLASATPFRILVPRPGMDLAKATHRIQTTMTMALTHVLEVKSLPIIGETEAKMWHDAVGAISWALTKESIERLPKDVRKGIEKFGKGLVVSGCWGVCVEGRNKVENGGHGWGNNT